MLSKGSPRRDSSIKIWLSLIGLSIQDLWANEPTDRLIKLFIFRQYKPHSHKSVQLRSLGGKERWRILTRNRRSQWCCTGGRWTGRGGRPPGGAATRRGGRTNPGRRDSSPRVEGTWVIKTSFILSHSCPHGRHLALLHCWYKPVAQFFHLCRIELALVFNTLSHFPKLEQHKTRIEALNQKGDHWFFWV